MKPFMCLISRLKKFLSNRAEKYLGGGRESRQFLKVQNIAVTSLQHIEASQGLINTSRNMFDKKVENDWKTILSFMRSCRKRGVIVRHSPSFPLFSMETNFLPLRKELDPMEKLKK